MIGNQFIRNCTGEYSSLNIQHGTRNIQYPNDLPIGNFQFILYFVIGYSVFRVGYSMTFAAPRKPDCRQEVSCVQRHQEVCRDCFPLLI